MALLNGWNEASARLRKRRLAEGEGPGGGLATSSRAEGGLFALERENLRLQRLTAELLLKNQQLREALASLQREEGMA
ncbi:MAG: hypothetical protein KGK08_04970 [Acidobacteriota bacterium]|nr:hypothetical protein [Acidobacteriota bacterium]